MLISTLVWSTHCVKERACAIGYVVSGESIARWVRVPSFSRLFSYYFLSLSISSSNSTNCLSIACFVLHLSLLLFIFYTIPLHFVISIHIFSISSSLHFIHYFSPLEMDLRLFLEEFLRKLRKSIFCNDGIFFEKDKDAEEATPPAITGHKLVLQRKRQKQSSFK